MALPDLANFDAGRFIGMQQAGQKRRTLAELGGLAAQGDFQGAQAAAFQGGEIDTGMALKGMNDDQRRQLVDQAASWAYQANNPQAWEAGRAQWQQQGFDIGPFEQREALLSQALTIKDRMAQANADRSFGLDQQRLGLERQRVAQAGAGGANEFGVTPIYGQDAQGNTVILQTGKSGQGAQAQFPEGVRPLSPGELSQDRSFGTRSGRLDADKPMAAAKAANMLQSLESQWQVVDQDIDRAIESIQSAWVPRTGLGAVAAGIPGTPQHDLSSLLDTIKANIGFDKLQEMRSNSPTGGALGQVSNFENQLLQATRGSLQQSQNPDQLVQNLTRIKQALAQLRQDRQAAFQRDFADVAGGEQQQAPANLIPPTGNANDGWTDLGNGIRIREVR